MTAKIHTNSEFTYLYLSQPEIPATPQSPFREFAPGPIYEVGGQVRCDPVEVTSIGCHGYPAIELRIELTAEQHDLIRSTMRPEEDDADYEDIPED